MQPPSNWRAFRVMLSKYLRTSGHLQDPTTQRTFDYDERTPVWRQFSRVRTYTQRGEAGSDVVLPPTPLGGGVKRCFDLAVALTTIILMAPTLLLVAAMICVTMGRPIFFVQQRVGFRRRQFGCLKFRTMVADASRLTRVYAKARPGLTGMWQISGRSTTTYSHRVLCDCYYIRRWSLSLDVAILLKTVPAVMKFNETA